MENATLVAFRSEFMRLVATLLRMSSPRPTALSARSRDGLSVGGDHRPGGSISGAPASVQGAAWKVACDPFEVRRCSRS
jgi:hypothetical protein